MSKTEVKTTTAGHTPGPWTARQEERARFPETAPRIRGAVIAEVDRLFGESITVRADTSDMNKTTEELNRESEANARLIAAAPELADVARELWSALDEVRSRDARWLGPKLRQLHDQLGSVVRKAEGGDQ